MEFRDDSWANLVFVSTLDRRRMRKEIAEAWDIPKTKLYQGGVQRELERLQQVKMVDISDEGVRADLDSVPFQTEIETFLDQGQNAVLEEYENGPRTLSEFISREDVREQLLELEVVKKFYRDDARNAKGRPKEFFHVMACSLAGEDCPETGSEYRPEAVREAVKDLDSEEIVLPTE